MQRRLAAAFARAGMTVLGNRVIAQDARHGALPTLYAATAPDLPGGEYVGPDGPGEMRGSPEIVPRAARAHDRTTARRLWEVSVRLTGVTYAFS